MIRKISVALLGVTVALFAVDRVAGFVAHGQFDGVAAWAQSWGDGSGADEQNDVTSEPATAPNVAGDWSGPLDDIQLGPGGIEIIISQNSGRLSGTWDSSFGGGSFVGSVSNKGRVHFTLQVALGNKGCHLNASGSLTSPNDIMCNYKVVGCKGNKHDHGTFEVSR